MDWDSLMEQWRKRQAGLASLLEEFGVTGSEYRVDLEEGMFYWVDAESRPQLVADARVLCSYALSNFSVLAGWANPHAVQVATVRPVPGLPESLEECSEQDAWVFAIRVAEAARADFIYRAPDPQVMVFLGLWNVRPPAPGDEFKAATPAEFVVELLNRLTGALEEGQRPDEEFARLLVNYGKALRHHAWYVHRGTSEEGPLLRCGARLITLGEEFDADAVGPVLAEIRQLQQEWEEQLE